MSFSTSSESIEAIGKMEITHSTAILSHTDRTPMSNNIACWIQLRDSAPISPWKVPLGSVRPIGRFLPSRPWDWLSVCGFAQRSSRRGGSRPSRVPLTVAVRGSSFGCPCVSVSCSFRRTPFRFQAAQMIFPTSCWATPSRIFAGPTRRFPSHSSLSPSSFYNSPPIAPSFRLLRDSFWLLVN